MRYKNLKEIKGFEHCKNNYIIYEDGRIFSEKTKKFLKPSKNTKGYFCIDLRNNNCFYKYPKVHRLVALAFIPNPNNLPQINHIDGNKENNHVNNLEWCDNLYNTMEAIRLGLKSKNEYHGKVSQYSLNGEYIATYNTPKDAAKSIGEKASGSNINRCVHKKRKSAYGYIWKKSK